MVFEEKTIESEIIYEGKILTLRKDKVEVPNGTAYREVVEHNGAAAIAALKDDNKLIMVKQYRKPAEKVMLEVPAGKIDGNEDPLDAAKRELKEETGYEASEWISLGFGFPSVGFSEEQIYLYIAKGLSGGETAFDDDEAIDIFEYDLNELVEMVMKGEMEDFKSQLLILMTAEYLRRNN